MRASTEAGRWKSTVQTRAMPVPEVGARMEEMLDSWSDYAGAQRIYRARIEGGEARLITAELIPLNDPNGTKYLQLIHHWNVWENDNAPEDPPDGGGIIEVGPVDYREVIDHGEPSYAANIDTTRDFLADHPVPRNYADYI